MNPPVYQFFRRSKNGPWLVVQIRDHVSRETVDASDLECYRATGRIETPFWKITVFKNSTLILTQAAAADMLAAGSIVLVPPESCIPWRVGHEEQAVTKWKNKSRGGNRPRFMEE